MPTDRTDIDDRHARIELMFANHRLERKDRVMRRAMAKWRTLETQQALIELDKPPDRIH